MIMDTSAVVAILRAEAGSAALVAAVDEAPHLGMSAASVLELAIVTAASGPELVDDFLSALGVEVVAVDAEHLRWARDAHRRFGRGSGSAARLNFGDCLSYAAAMATEQPLLFVGNDFGHTDVAPAVA
ncbi:MAG: type II toxin-antitoxin system VapC family toxin [Propionibacteriales bacterium]|nr:type II toxin-antitoxin system VapC family toxin [Propionibacteriales bacterium]